MQGINCLQDLKARLVNLGVEVSVGEGWFFETKHGRWTMSFGNIYLDRILIKDLAEVLNKKKAVKVKVKVEKPKIEKSKVAKTKSKVVKTASVKKKPKKKK
jgi:hypothetical protein